MGDRYLTDLADVCRRVGVPVHEVDGWQTRARGSGGYEAGRPDHVIVHHTASGPSSDGWPDVNYCTYGDEDAPLCNLYLSRVPELYVCAAGATNTNGAGYDPCQMIPDDSMNSHAIGIEAGNNGTGEAWPDPMLDAYLQLCRVLCDAYNIPVSAVHSHWEWAPTRKNDPAGGPRWQHGGGPSAISWTMDEFRADLAAGTGDTEGEDMPLSDEDVQKVAKAVWDHIIEGDQPDERKPAGWRLRQIQGTVRYYLGGWKEAWQLPDQTLLKKIDEQTSDR
jgi:hypothetical protein